MLLDAAIAPRRRSWRARPRRRLHECPTTHPHRHRRARGRVLGGRPGRSRGRWRQGRSRVRSVVRLRRRMRGDARRAGPRPDRCALRRRPDRRGPRRHRRRRRHRAPPRKVALHPDWRHRNGPRNFLDDVAIVELAAPVTGVTPVRLGGPAVREAWILGRGRAFAPGTGTAIAETLDSSLRSAPLRTISDAQCARAFRGYEPADGERFDRRMRCAIDADGRAPLHSGCNGDSGGPLWTGTPEAPVQLGVVSWGGDRCGADHLPSVFADVERDRGFILDPAPTWAPTTTAKAIVTISGPPRQGRRLTCSARDLRLPDGAAVAYSWSIVGAGRGGYSVPTVRRSLEAISRRRGRPRLPAGVPGRRRQRRRLRQRRRGQRADHGPAVADREQAVRSPPHPFLERGNLTCDRMVTYAAPMDAVFRALADPTRRGLLDELFKRDGQTLSVLEERVPMTRFGVMKHLRVLEDGRAGDHAPPRTREAPFPEPDPDPAHPRPVGEQVRRTVGRHAHESQARP